MFFIGVTIKIKTINHQIFTNVCHLQMVKPGTSIIVTYHHTNKPFAKTTQFKNIV